MTLWWKTNPYHSVNSGGSIRALLGCLEKLFKNFVLTAKPGITICTLTLSSPCSSAVTV